MSGLCSISPTFLFLLGRKIAAVKTAENHYSNSSIKYESSLERIQLNKGAKWVQKSEGKSQESLRLVGKAVWDKRSAFD